MSGVDGRVAEAAQLRALCRAFLARFFESENTSGRGDLRDSFFWIIAALATPGLLLPIYQQFHWNDVANRFGLNAVTAYALFDKTIYLTWTFVAIGFLSAVVWPSLLLERRDGWILGSLPVRARSVILGKLGALAAYIGLISAGMHAGASLLFGTFLGSLTTWGGMFGAIAGQFVSSFGLSLFTFTAVTAIASTALAIAGPRHFPRVSAVLQITIVALLASGLLLLPALAATGRALAGDGRSLTPWMLNAPPLWFLALGETVAGNGNALLSELTTRAGLGLSITIVVILATFPVAGLRAMRSVAAPISGAPRGLTSVLSTAGAHVLARSSPALGAVQFALATLGRVNGHRLVMTVAIGLGLVVVLPAVFVWMPREIALSPRRPSLGLLAAPLVLIYLVQAGLRIALALPSSLPARWVFTAAPAPMFFGREAARSLLLGLGVAPAMLVAAVAWSMVWSPAIVIPNLLVMAIAAWLLAEIHLWGFVGLPCAQPLPPGTGNLQSRWPAYFIGMLLFCVQLPYLERVFTTNPAGFALMAAILGILGAVASRSGRQAAWVNAVTGDPQGLLLLDLSAPQTKAPRESQTHYPHVGEPLITPGLKTRPPSEGVPHA